MCNHDQINKTSIKIWFFYEVNNAKRYFSFFITLLLDNSFCWDFSIDNWDTISLKFRNFFWNPLLCIVSWDFTRGRNDLVAWIGNWIFIVLHNTCNSPRMQSKTKGKIFIGCYLSFRDFLKSSKNLHFNISRNCHKYSYYKSKRTAYLLFFLGSGWAASFQSWANSCLNWEIRAGSSRRIQISLLLSRLFAERFILPRRSISSSTRIILVWT